MSKITFSDKEIKLLQQNPNLKRVSSLAITYGSRSEIQER